MSSLHVQEISFQYGKRTILQNSCLEVRDGEAFCLIGPNGCGKTTLIDCILGLRKPKSGQIVLDGTKLTHYRLSDLAKKLAYVPQNHQKTFPYTVKDIVLMGRSAYTSVFSTPSENDVFIVNEIISSLNLHSFREMPYTELSGGEGQLVMIARALAQQASMVIMDEPTAHLDFKNELLVLETIAHLVKEQKISILMATHFPNHAFYLQNIGVPTRVGLMDGTGQIISGEPEEILSEANLQDVYNINARIISCKIDGSTVIKQVIPVGTYAG